METLDALVVVGMFMAGFSGLDAPRAVFPFLSAGPVWIAGRFSYSAQCLVRQWTQYLRQSTYFLRSSYLAVTCSVLYVAEEFTKMLSFLGVLFRSRFRIQGLFGSTVDTCMASVYEALAFHTFST